MKKVVTSLITFNLILLSSLTFAGNTIALNYNIIPDVKNGYVVDSAHTNQISFSLFETENDIYYNNKLVNIENDRFNISIEGLTGKQEFIISNDLGDSVNYTYYISDINGYLEGYKFDELKNKNLKTYIKTIKGVSIIYTEKEKKSVNEIEKIILSLPEKMLINLKEIRLVPAKHESGAAGITKYNKITFYNISKYSKNTIKNIVIHEITHTWAHELRKDKIIDYSYTDYRQAVTSDKKFPSKYAKANVQNGDYSEDFAESVSFYLINSKSFERKYPARADYIKNLIND